MKSEAKKRATPSAGGTHPAVEIAYPLHDLLLRGLCAALAVKRRAPIGTQDEESDAEYEARMLARGREAIRGE